MKLIVTQIKKFKKQLPNVFFTILFIAITILFTRFLMNSKYYDNLQDYSYIATIVSLIFVATQVRIYVSDAKRNDNRLRKQKAIELAQVYEKEFIPIISVIGTVFRRLKIDKEIFATLDESKIRYFSKRELDNLLPLESIDNYNRKLLSRECLEYYSELKFYSDEMRNININVELSDDSKDVMNNEQVKDDIDMQINNILWHKQIYEFNCLIPELLNKLESFAMYFNYGIADEEVVYQSIQQTYRSTVKLLYIFIASINVDPKNKYYTNIIELYNTWNNRYMEKLKEEQKLDVLHEIGAHRGTNI